MSPKTTASQGKTPRAATSTGTAKTPSPAKKPAARKPSVKTAAGASPRRATKRGIVLPEDRERLIAEAAYFRAASRNFSGGGELDDWLEAEAEIDALLSSRGAG